MCMLHVVAAVIGAEVERAQQKMRVSQFLMNLESDHCSKPQYNTNVLYERTKHRVITGFARAGMIAT